MQMPTFNNKSTSTARSVSAWAHLEVDPAVHGEEPLAVLHLDVPPEQQHREGADQRGLPQVHAGIPDLHTREGGGEPSQLTPATYTSGSTTWAHF